MPQLDTVYTFSTYLWTWLTLYLISQKIKTFMITTSPKKQQIKPDKMKPTMPWT